MAGVAASYGETDAGASHLLPLSVDGLVVVASISLVEIAGRIRTAAAQPQPAAVSAPSLPADPLAIDRAATSPPQAVTGRPLVLAAPQPATAAGVDDSTGDFELGRAVPATPAGPDMMPVDARRAEHLEEGHHHQAGERGQALPARAATVPPEPTSSIPCGGRTPAPDAAGDGKPGRDVDDTDTDGRNGRPETDDDDAEVPSGTAAAVAYWHEHDPSLHPADIAARIGRSERTEVISTTNGVGAVATRT
jgi:hypothetical protein